MLRIYFLQQWFNLSDPAVEEALYDSQAMRRFVDIDLGREPVPDETTVCRFRHLLEAHDLGQKLFDEVQRHLAAKGLKVSHWHDCRCDHHQCAVVDQECRQGARSRDASDKEGQPMVFRDEGAFRDRQPNQADPCGGGDTGQCRRRPGLARTAAWQGNPCLGRSGLSRSAPRSRQKAPRAQDFTNRRYRHRGVANPVERAKNRSKSKVRAKVEHSIGVIKRVFGFAKVRYRGLKKNEHRLIVTCALANLFIVHRQLLRLGEA
jgi:transposase, IS5 family